MKCPWCEHALAEHHSGTLSETFDRGQTSVETSIWICDWCRCMVPKAQVGEQREMIG